VPFGYYARLSKKDKAIYDRSDRVTSIVLPVPEPIRPMVDVLRQGLAADDRRVVETASQALARAITVSLRVEPVDVGVLAVRPRLRGAGELHGLYTREDGRPRRLLLHRRQYLLRCCAHGARDSGYGHHYTRRSPHPGGF